MQIYCDYIFYATNVAGAPLRITPLEPLAADLHYRGFSAVRRATPYSPHIPFGTATEFASLLLLNQGDETFRQTPLPVEAQFAPIYAILLGDFNRDGNKDLLLGGNFYGAPPEQGRYDAGYGCLLLGNGAGTFTSVSLQNSGFVVAGEIRQIKAVQTAAGKTLIMAARNNDTVMIFR